jgi:hypothetical protein
MRVAIATVVVILLGAACARGEGGETAKRVTLNWKMRVEGRTLVVEYTIVNQLDQPLNVADSLTENGTELPGRLIVGVEELIRGTAFRPRPRVAFAKESWVPPLSQGYPSVPVTMTRLRPGQSRHWTASMPLPLVAWAPTGPFNDLEDNPRSAVLLISYSIGNPNHPDNVIPRGCDRFFIVSKELDLPPGVTIGKQPKN